LPSWLGRATVEASHVGQREVLVGALRFAVAALLLVACSHTPADDGGVALDLTHAPHIRAGLWAIDTILDGNLRLPANRLCDGGRSIARENPDGKVRWSGRRLSDHEFLLIGDREDDGRKNHARIDISGDLSKAFVMKSHFWTDGFPSNPSSNEATYQYLGPCPEGMRVETSWFHR
jgi:hypothetical protein